ncbi:NADH-quinone oxidoreductase subunit C [Desulfobaculum bizertense]|uniref:NADH-quinone oxidoreductase subunit C n=1 Tax=Desulfobaculum bizertense TaxID=376490 RepID=UPI001F187FB7|nr:NADH-quinone oxidoreductase subunit C [Desulfobaculum bizertense]UIJ36820.1 NADH-quinone oxidoreductase subunit C [Desulfobaculum bizertense]
MLEWLGEISSVCNALCDPEKTGQSWRVLLEKAQLRAAVRRAYREGYFLEDVTCTHIKEGFGVLYHFGHYELHHRLTYQVILAEDAATIPSIADIYQGAEWHERECMDFYPVEFTDNPNPLRLLLPQEMTEKPLLKPEKKLSGLLDIMCISDVVHCESDHPLAQAMSEQVAAQKAEAAEAAQKAEKSDAEDAAPAE